MIKYRGLYIFTGLLVVGALIIIYFYPKQIHTELKGVSYQIGADWEEAVTISIEGMLKRKLGGSKTFVGTIDISGEDIPVPEQYREVTIKFRNHSGLLLYAYNGRGFPKQYAYGSLFVNRDFSEVSILKYKEHEDRPESKGWSGADGLMITAPAVDRQEALELSRSLSKDEIYIHIFSNEINRVKSIQ